MVGSQNRGDPNIDPKVIKSLLMRPWNPLEDLEGPRTQVIGLQGPNSINPKPWALKSYYLGPRTLRENPYYG